MVRRKPGSPESIDEKELRKLVKEIELINGDGGIIVVFSNFNVADEIAERITGHNKTVKRIKVENGDDVARYLKDCTSFDEDVIVWTFPESPREDILKALNIFRERFIECKKPNVLVFTLGYHTELQKRAPDFWRYKNNVYEFIRFDRAIPYEYIDDKAAVLDVDEKIEFYEKVLDKIKDNKKKIKILNILSRLYWTKGDLDRAEKYSKEALKLIEKNHKNSLYLLEYAEALNNLGNIYSDKEEFAEAEKHYLNALKLYEKLKEKGTIYKRNYATILSNLGGLYSIGKQFDKAKNCFEKALEIHSELKKDPMYLPDYAETLHNLGTLYLDIKKFDKAEEYLKKALRVYEKLSEIDPIYQKYYAAGLHNLGALYVDKGELDKAEEYLKKALRVYEKLQEKYPQYVIKEYVWILVSLAILHLLKDEFDKSAEYWTKALELSKKYKLNEITREIEKMLQELGILDEVINPQNQDSQESS